MSNFLTRVTKMMTQVMRKKINWKDVGFYTVAVSIIGAILFIMGWAIQSGNKAKDEWKEVACPSLLSIGRTSRDTLIVMKVQPLCNDYVLDNLK